MELLSIAALLLGFLALLLGAGVWIAPYHCTCGRVAMLYRHLHDLPGARVDWQDR